MERRTLEDDPTGLIELRTPEVFPITNSKILIKYNKSACTVQTNIYSNLDYCKYPTVSM